MIKKKIAIFLTLTLLLISTMGSRAEAANQVVPTLTFSGTTAVCRGTVTAPGKNISITMKLMYGSTIIDSWPGSGTSFLSLSKNHAGCVSGRTYILKVSGTIDGVAFPEVSVSKVC